MKLSELTTVAKLGSGAFGMVTLVKHKDGYYALKQMHKSQIVQMELQVSRSSQIQDDRIHVLRSQEKGCKNDMISLKDGVG